VYFVGYEVLIEFYVLRYTRNLVSTCHLLSQWFLVWLILTPRRMRRRVPLKHVDNQRTTLCYSPEDKTLQSVLPLCEVFSQKSVFYGWIFSPPLHPQPAGPDLYPLTDVWQEGRR
jgi:hypothetical protein